MKYTATIEAYRTRYEKDPTTGGRKRTDETVRAVIEIELELQGIAFDRGSAAVRNRSGKAQCLGGSVKARIISEEILDSRTRY